MSTHNQFVPIDTYEIKILDSKMSTISLYILQMSMYYIHVSVKQALEDSASKFGVGHLMFTWV